MERGKVIEISQFLDSRARKEQMHTRRPERNMQENILQPGDKVEFVPADPPLLEAARRYYSRKREATKK